LDKLAELPKQLPFRVFVFLAIRRKRLAGCAPDQDSRAIRREQAIDLVRFERGDVATNERRAVIFLESVPAIFIDVDAACNFESAPQEAVGQATRSAKDVHD
jgi:hypothetical protein